MGVVPITPGVIYIDVYNCRAAIARFIADEHPGITTREYAANWEDLESDAIDAVEAQGGSITWSGFYTCPDELTERATWEGE